MMGYKNLKKVLIVDDQPPNLLIISLMLDELGYQYDSAPNGLEGVEKFMHSKYSMVFMDIEMPVLDGYEACRKIRDFENEQSRDATPIIIVTASPLAEVMERVSKFNIADVMQKPFSFEVFSASVLAYAN